MVLLSTIVDAMIIEPESSPALAAVPSVPDVTVAIVSWNSAVWIESCLHAIEGAARGRRFEVVVWDNASSDGSADVAERIADPRVLVVRSRGNRGFSGGLNGILDVTTGRHVLLLNPDCELAAGAIDTLSAYLDSHPGIGAAAPLLLNPDGTPQREFQLRRFPTLGGVAAEILLLQRLAPGNRASANYRYRDLEIERPVEVEQPAAAALMIRRSVIDQVGPFDERFEPAWLEDVDYAKRIWNAGFPIVLVPDATATHEGGVSIEHLTMGTFVEVWYRNLYKYALKWWPAQDAEKLRWVILAGMLLRSAALAVGMAPDGENRWRAIAAHLRVFRKAFIRWDDRSLSS
jgi:GT2 family glycosyltransferase